MEKWKRPLDLQSADSLVGSTDWTVAASWLAAAGYFFNSSFASSVVGALAGAFFGALAATKFAARSEVERVKLQDLKRNNSGVVLATSIANHSLTFKKQLVREVVLQFSKDRERYQEFLEELKAGKPMRQFEVQYDFRNITFFKHESEELRSLLLNEISPEPKTTMAAMQLWQSLHSLEISINQRLVEMQRLIQLRGTVSEDEYAHVYFGLMSDAGNIDERYSDTMDAIQELLDSAIFFSTHIADKLSERGKELSIKLGRKAVKPVTWSFEGIIDQDLLPDPSEFSDWT